MKHYLQGSDHKHTQGNHLKLNLMLVIIRSSETQKELVSEDMSDIFTNEWPSKSHTITLWCRLFPGPGAAVSHLLRGGSSALSLTRPGSNAGCRDGSDWGGTRKCGSKLYCGGRWFRMEGCAGTVRWRRALVPFVLIIIIIFFPRLHHS